MKDPEKGYGDLPVQAMEAQGKQDMRQWMCRQKWSRDLTSGWLESWAPHARMHEDCFSSTHDILA